MPRPLAFDPNGPLQCCAMTLMSYVLTGQSEEEGTVVPCLECQARLVVRDGRWQHKEAETPA